MHGVNDPEYDYLSILIDIYFLKVSDRHRISVIFVCDYSYVDITIKYITMGPTFES